MNTPTTSTPTGKATRQPTPGATDDELQPWCNVLWPLVHVRLLLNTYSTQGVTPTTKATGKSVEAVRKKAYQLGLRMCSAAISESNRQAALFSWRHLARKPRGQAHQTSTGGAFASIWAVAAACIASTITDTLRIGHTQGAHPKSEGLQTGHHSVPHTEFFFPLEKIQNGHHHQAQGPARRRPSRCWKATQARRPDVGRGAHG